MAEVVALTLAKTIIGKVNGSVSDYATNLVVEELKGAISVMEEVEAVKKSFQALQPTLEEAAQNEYDNPRMKHWVKSLKSVAYDMDDLLDEVAYHALLREVNKGHFRDSLRCYFSSSNSIITRLNWSHQIKALRSKLDGTVREKDQFNLADNPVKASLHMDQKSNPSDSSPVIDKTIVGREEDLEYLKLSFQKHGTPESGLVVVPVVGVAGIGKTTMAKLVYHDRELAEEFDLKLWVHVSYEFDLTKILQGIIHSAATAVNEDIIKLSDHWSYAQLVRKVQDTLEGKKYLLVLDDVWVDNASKWHQLCNVLNVSEAQGSVLITTRNENVVNIVRSAAEPYYVFELSDSNCLDLFKKIAFRRGEDPSPNLVKIAESFIKKCKGIPKLVEILANYLADNRDESTWKWVDSADEFTKNLDSFKQLLRSSYDQLPFYLKPLFISLSLIGRGYRLAPRVLTYYWSALGLLHEENGRSIEDKGYAYYNELISRFSSEHADYNINGQLSNVRMPDVIFDLAQEIMGEELAIVHWNDANKISESCRHIIWGNDGNTQSLWDKPFPDSLLEARKVRSFRGTNGCGPVTQSFIQGIIDTMCSLRILILSGFLFEELPDSVGSLKHLRMLSLSGNNLIKSLPDTICNLLNLQQLNLYGCSNLKELPTKLYRLVNLRDFGLATCQESLDASKLNSLPHLYSLRISHGPELVSLWEDALNGGRGLKSLRTLVLYNCPKLTSLPKGIDELKELFISGYLPLDFEHVKDQSGLKHLEELCLYNLPQLKCLPDCLKSSASTLKYLVIDNFQSLTALPNWIQSFVSLQSIFISNCPNLSALPEALQHVSLSKLVIKDCPLLSARCAAPDGLDYYLIKNIPKVLIDDLTHFED